jgi:hypothetical protein
MTSEEASTPTATAEEERKPAEEERKPAEEERKPAEEERKPAGMMQRVQRLPLPGVGMPVAMPTGLPGRVLWWGGLAALAAFEVVDWPVAILVGAGSWVAEQNAKAAAQSQRAEQRQAA